MSDAEVKVQSQFSDTPEGWASRWAVEMVKSREALKEWRKAAKEINNIFIDKRTTGTSDSKRLNLFTANVLTQRAMLMGQMPKISAKRRYADPNDDVARVAAEMIQRLLNTDLDRDHDGYVPALRRAIFDRLVPGLGFVRCRYVAEFETVPATPPQIDPVSGVEVAPEIPEHDRKTWEDVEIDYVNWEDVLWSAGARTFSEVRWFGFRCEMTQEQLKERFGPAFQKVYPNDWERYIDLIPLNAGDRKESEGEPLMKKDPWSRAEVWEIWDKENRKVWWWVEGFDEILDDQPDPLELEGFWPFPEPLVANVTTSAFLPRPDYVLAQDQYQSINTLTERISLLTKAIRVVGVYNGGSTAVERMLGEAMDNELIPVDNWAMFAERGGVKGQIDWLPLEQVVGAMEKLKEQRQEEIALLYQVTGMSDIMRGQSGGQATATEQAIKAKFASVRINEAQNNIAVFAGGVQRIKAEIIAKWFDPQTILSRSNIENSLDPQLAGQAIQLIKNRFASFRIEVSPDAIAAADYAALKQERMEAMQAIGQFMQMMGQVGAAIPQSIPYLLRMLQWAFAGLPGANQMESVLDQMVTAAEQQVKQMPPPGQGGDPAAAAEQQKIAMEMKQSQMEHGIKMKELQAKGAMSEQQLALDMRRQQMEIINEALRAAMPQQPQQTQERPQ